MALPMDEQRILEEMERMLAADDPRLAARLAAFGQPGLGQTLRTRRARATLSVMALVLIAAVAGVIYLMSTLRPGPSSPAHGSTPVATSPPAKPSSGATGQKAGAAPRARLRTRTLGTGTAAATAHCAATFAPNC
ncbi:MAG TPA: DUF3040 domain-containing protein [Streptosporangiaceae bacterium]